MRECSRSSWHMFSKYHYLSSQLPGGLNFFFGLYYENQQIGFAALSEYKPWNGTSVRMLHTNRIVIHPDYCGIGLAKPFINAIASKYRKRGFRICEKMSSLSRYKQLRRDSNWRLMRTGYLTPSGTGNMLRDTGFRNKVRYWCFEYLGERNV